MSVKVAINGFGRIGRLAFRQMFGAEGYEVVAINDLTKPSMLAHLLKYDTAQGGYAGRIGENKHTVSADDEAGTITVDGKTLTIYAKAKAAELPWGEIGVDVVLECTGFYTSKEKAQAHIDAGAKKVVISAPAGNDLPTIVYNVNHETLTTDDKIISAASCTTNCLAPMAKALNDYAPIQSGIMSTIHAYTGDQMILDGPHRKGDLRRARAGAANIVPNSTGAAKAIGLVIPELNGKLIGSAQRVPVPTGSTTILTAVVKGTDVTKEGINAAMKAAATESYGYNEEPIVSSDVIGMKYGSLFDATQTMVSKIADDLYEVQVVSWYDNENSYTSQMVRTIKYFAVRLFGQARFLSHPELWKTRNFPAELFIFLRKSCFTFVSIVFFRKTFPFYMIFSRNPEFLTGNFQKSIDIIENMCYYKSRPERNEKTGKNHSFEWQNSCHFFLSLRSNCNQ